MKEKLEELDDLYGDILAAGKMKERFECGGLREESPESELK